MRTRKRPDRGQVVSTDDQAFDLTINSPTQQLPTPPDSPPSGLLALLPSTQVIDMYSMSINRKRKDTAAAAAQGGGDEQGVEVASDQEQDDEQAARDAAEADAAEADDAAAHEVKTARATHTRAIAKKAATAEKSSAAGNNKGKQRLAAWTHNDLISLARPTQHERRARDGRPCAVD
jgi:uncharacterized membrane protein YqiK